MHPRISHIQLNGVDISVFVSCIRTGIPAKKLDNCHLLQGRSRGDCQSWCVKGGCNGDTDPWISTSWSNDAAFFVTLRVLQPRLPYSDVPRRAARGSRDPKVAAATVVLTTPCDVPVALCLLSLALISQAVH
ncbi:hypothetical protein IG631_15263 [Alternaria alternata]|nr:hypothetical protein IG631_15263 [Alternaria alternata]